MLRSLKPTPAEIADAAMYTVASGLILADWTLAYLKDDAPAMAIGAVLLWVCTVSWFGWYAEAAGRRRG